MFIRPEFLPSEPMLQFLKRCYRFVSREWNLVEREPLPDQGFEQRFRESCMHHLQDWSISEEREMHLGQKFETESGVLHEVDIVAIGPNITAISELKNRRGALPDKNDVIVFFAKILDYLTRNPVLVSKDICLVFVSSSSYDPNGLAACLGLGIHPVSPDVRPLPILINNALIMETAMCKGLKVGSEVRDRFENLCSQINNLSSVLSGTWLDNRCGYLSDDSIMIRAVAPSESTAALAHRLRQVNGDCMDILSAFKMAENELK